MEPLVGRLVLPTFGGTPAVWTTILFFFQAVLLAGYLYGHLSVTRLGPAGPVVHVVISVIALVALIVAPQRIADLQVTGASPVLSLLWILVLIVGLPAFVLTTTTPILSGWFARARSTRGRDPYWLYALSNGGSLLALLAYPVLIEPNLGLAQQRGIWTIGYAVLIGSVVVAALRSGWRTGERAAESDIHAAADPPIDWKRRARWLLLAFVPSGLLSAVTNFIATDLVSAPLLWVAPLALYLASFVVAFSPRGGRLVRGSVILAPAMVTLLWVPYGSAGGWPLLVILTMELGAFAIIAVALHGVLARDRPAPSHLTSFYLTLATGGALASAFVAIVAPTVFPDVWEYPILLVAALVALALTSNRAAVVRRAGRALDFRPFYAGFRRRVVPYIAVGAVMMIGLVATGALASEAGIRWLAVGGLVLLVGARPWFLTASTTLVLLLATFVLAPPATFQARSFFGVSKVLTSPDGALTLLMNGTTVHGSQANDDAKRRSPQSYYVKAGPAGSLFRVASARGATGHLDVGVAGLGSGALAGYVESDMAMTFFEIDPIVVDVASDPTFFTYLADAPVEPAVILGDARLSLALQPTAAFDLLVLDAFSSDTPPVHLFTVEAVADEIRVLRPSGLLAFHISNRYYDLGPAVAAAVAQNGLTTLERWHDVGAIHEPGETPSRWLAASSDPETLAALRADGWVDIRPAAHPFTDDYSDLIRYLRLGS